MSDDILTMTWWGYQNNALAFEQQKLIESATYRFTTYDYGNV